jgi:aminopeptidase N
MKKDAAPKTIYLKEYQTPHYKISDVHLTFDLNETRTIVQSRLNVEKNVDLEVSTLVLNGENLELLEIKLDGLVLETNRFKVDAESLAIFEVPKKFVLEIKNVIVPLENKALEGLFKSGEILCTQNEPEGMRRITYFVDRPDNLARYTTKLIADAKKYPILLSNGNLIAKGAVSEGRHFAEWNDPFPKPSYLYALVAGDLGLVKDEYVTKSGRKVDLRVYCDKGNEYKCHHAMESLKKSMKWDEDTFNLEYDLDIYMIVAVDSFNMGAMENKGLNIFNSAYVLADPKTATDDNFSGVESVVAHEYFHNWTGNRITCRDWFQLTLKEGLTVLRDQLFSQDMNSSDVERIHQVMNLKQRQFVEDAGPSSHPIRPCSYIEINNFYTPTIYEKGAEVIRMLRTLVGPHGFKKGMKKYVELYDGQAVTTEDFLHAFEVSCGLDLTHFKRWYHQAGTPTVKADWKYIPESLEFHLTLEQIVPATPGQPTKDWMPMPISVGLIDKNGVDVESKLLELNSPKQTFIFNHLKSKPIPSINRGFTAPVHIQSAHTEEDLYFLISHDSDAFNRYEAGQVMTTRVLMDLLAKKQKSAELSLHHNYVMAMERILSDSTLDPSLKAAMLRFPAQELLHAQQKIVDHAGTHFIREWPKKELVGRLESTFIRLYHEMMTPGEYKLDQLSVGKRSLRNMIAGYLAALESPQVEELLWEQFSRATNMTDELSALRALSHYNYKKGDEAMDRFFHKWKHEMLVMTKWFSVQASNPRPGTLANVQKLEKNSAYNATIPNLARSLVGAYGMNYVRFHDSSGESYQYMAQKVLEFDRFNPQISTRFIESFEDLNKLPSNLQKLMRPELEAMIKDSKISKNLFEMIQKILAT